MKLTLCRGEKFYRISSSFHFPSSLSNNSKFFNLGFMLQARIDEDWFLGSTVSPALNVAHGKIRVLQTIKTGLSFRGRIEEHLRGMVFKGPGSWISAGLVVLMIGIVSLRVSSSCELVNSLSCSRVFRGFKTFCRSKVIPTLPWSNKVNLIRNWWIMKRHTLWMSWRRRRTCINRLR